MCVCLVGVGARRSQSTAMLFLFFAAPEPPNPGCSANTAAVPSLAVCKWASVAATAAVTAFSAALCPCGKLG